MDKNEIKFYKFLGELKEVQDSIEDVLETSRGLELGSKYLPISKLGNILKQVKIEQGLNLDDLAKLSGVSYGTVSKVLNGNLNVNMNSLLKLLSTLGIEICLKK